MEAAIAVTAAAILPTGDIFACRRVQNSNVGNVFEDRLADIGSAKWSNTAITKNLRNAPNASCWHGAVVALR